MAEATKRTLAPVTLAKGTVIEMSPMTLADASDGSFLSHTMVIRSDAGGILASFTGALALDIDGFDAGEKFKLSLGNPDVAITLDYLQPDEKLLVTADVTLEAVLRDDAELMDGWKAVQLTRKGLADLAANALRKQVCLSGKVQHGDDMIAYVDAHTADKAKRKRPAAGTPAAEQTPEKEADADIM